MPPMLELYHSDLCDEDRRIAIVDASTDCARLAADHPDAVWGVRRDGTCEDVRDTTVAEVCATWQADSGAGIGLYHSDRCASDEILASVHAGIDPRYLTATDAVWGVKLGGVCRDVADLPFADAVARYGPPPPPLVVAPDRAWGVLAFRTDDCTGELLAVVSPASDCRVLSSVSGGRWIESVEVGGRCFDVQDQPFVDACVRYGGR